jgi:hypothetical protein
MSEIEIVDRIVQETLSHALHPVSGKASEVLIPLLMEVQPGKELITKIAQQLRARNEFVWVSRLGTQMIHKLIRIYVDPEGFHDPVHLRAETLLMVVLEANAESSKYGASVLLGTLNTALTDAHFAGYQGSILVLHEEEAEESDED